MTTRTEILETDELTHINEMERMGWSVKFIQNLAQTQVQPMVPSNQPKLFHLHVTTWIIVFEKDA